MDPENRVGTVNVSLTYLNYLYNQPTGIALLTFGRMTYLGFGSWTFQGKRRCNGNCKVMGTVPVLGEVKRQKVKVLISLRRPTVIASRNRIRPPREIKI